MSSRPGRHPKTGVVGLSVLALVLTVGLGVLLWQAVQLSSVAIVAAQIDAIGPWATGMRLGIIGLVATTWPRLVERARKTGCIGKDHARHLRAQRWRVVGWLLVIELVLGQGLLHRLITDAPGPIA